MPAGGGEPRVLVYDAPLDGPISWSPDGRTLLVSSWDASRCEPLVGLNCAFTDVWAVDVPTGRLRRVLAEAQNARFSPNGKWIVFQDFAPGTASNYVGVARRWAQDTFEMAPQWSPSGRFVLSRVRLRGRLFVVPFGGGRSRRVGVRRQATWSPKRRSIAFGDWEGVSVTTARGTRANS
jgi:Tol biopolymer transport system component